MKRQQLATDATIHSVRNMLDSEITYVSQVHQAMFERQKEHGPVVVRIGITGTGRRPSYRIETADGTGSPIAFDAQTQRPFTDVNVNSPWNWSTNAMTFDEVDALLIGIRSRA